MKTLVRALVLAGLATSFAASAREPDTEAVEFYHHGLKHYFITATGSEARALDLGGAGGGWVRTGRSFQAWLEKAGAAPDAHPVCRFYSVSANSHFYTADDSECQQLRALESAERSRSGEVRGWMYEGVAFHVQVPVNGQCPAGTTPVTRVYNDGFRSGEGSNHRFVDDDELRSLMEDRAWKTEGIALCAAAKPASGGNANLPPTTTNFESLAGTWSGTVRWKSENRGVETRSDDPLTLTFAPDGTVTGSGKGCTFTGRLTRGDGFRSYFAGDIAATGCAVSSFDGAYERLKVERYGDNTVSVQLKRGDGSVEARIDGRLANDAGATPPTPSTGLASIAGEWAGTVAWLATRRSGGVETELAAANKPLALSISTSGAVSGSGFGCTVTGTLGTAIERGFAGSLTLAGCENALFNGVYPQAKAKREDRGRIEVELERETEDGQGRLKIEVEGDLQGESTGGTTPNPNPNPGAPATVTGSWSGPATFVATERPRGGSEAVLFSGNSAVTLTIAEGGAVTGSGLGCSFTGQLSLAAGGTTVAGGTVTAAGCTQSVFNGTYSGVQVARDNGRLEVELERESESGGTRVKVKIEGKLSRA